MDLQHCPRVEFAARTELEHLAWRVTAAPGVWRLDWIDEKQGDKWGRKRIPQGLLIGEALSRLPPMDEATSVDMRELLTAIERGAIDGVQKGKDVTIEEERGEG